MPIELDGEFVWGLQGGSALLSWEFGRNAPRENFSSVWRLNVADATSKRWLLIVLAQDKEASALTL